MEYIILKIAYWVCLINYYIGISPPPPEKLIRLLQESKKNNSKK